MTGSQGGLNGLPLELFLEITSHLTGSSEWLFSTMLISRTFCNALLPALYRTPDVHGYNAMRKLSATLRDCSHLSNEVLSLCLFVDDLPKKGSDFGKDIDRQIALQETAMPLLPNCRTMVVKCGEEEDAAPGLHEILRWTRSCPRLYCLFVEAPCKFHEEGYLESDMEQFPLSVNGDLYISDSLRIMHVAANWKLAEYRWLWALLPPRLSTLSVRDVGWNSAGSGLEVLTLLPLNPAKIIRRLLLDPMDPTTLGNIPLSFPNLEHLKVVVRPTAPAWIHHPFLKLRSLDLDLYWNEDFQIEQIPEVRALITALAEAMEHHMLPRIEEITLRNGVVSQSMQFQHFMRKGRLQIICQKGGIKLRIATANRPPALQDLVNYERHRLASSSA